MRCVAGALVVAVAAGGCGMRLPDPNADTPGLAAVASPNEYAPYRVGGTATITGTVRQREHDGASAAGRRIVLDPDTPYARRWYAEVGLIPGRFDDLPADTTFRALRRTTLTDSAGQFSFSSLQSGSYIVAGVVTWEITDGRFGMRAQTGILSQPITLKDGETARVVLVIPRSDHDR